MKKIKNFLSDYGNVILYILVIFLLIGLSTNDSQTGNHGSSTHSSKSGIYYSETCPITTCNDGSCSSSTGRGTCSHHGGIRR